MKILEIHIQNYKKIEVLHLILDGKSLKVAGTTGQGKTTAISALWDVLETVGDPIRNAGKGPGAKASVSVVVGEPGNRFVAERTYKAGETKITIQSEDKKKKVTARDFQTWVSSLAVNPHKIMNMKPQEQTATLLRAAEVPEGVDLDQIDADRATAHQAREDARKDKTRLSEEIGIKPREVQPLDIQATLDELTQRQTEGAAAVQELERLDAGILAAKEVHADLLRRVAEACARVDALQEEREPVAEWIRENVDPGREDELRKDLARAQEINAEAQLWTTWQERAARLEEASLRFTENDLAVKACEAAKRAAVEAIQWPIAGLSVVDGVIYFRGVPLDQAGESEKLLVCGALAAHEIGKAPLRVVRLDGVEAMSAEDFQTLEAIFEEKDIQVLSSRVTRGDLEDGEICIHEGTVYNPGAPADDDYHGEFAR